MLRLSVFAGGVLFVSACIAPGPGVPPAVPLPQSALRHTPAPPAYWPTQGWRYSAPEEQGVSSRALSDIVRFVLDSGLPVHNLFVVRHGFVVLDVSFYPFQAGTRHDIASITKSVTSLAIGAAVQRRSLNADDPVSRYVPAWRGKGDARDYVGPNVFRERMALSTLMERLDPARFLQISRFHVVRIDAVREVHPWSHGDYHIVLHTGVRLTWTRRFRAETAGAFSLASRS